MLNDRYVLGEMIGSGGMSEVFAAEDTLLGRDVAVKMLRPEMARDVNFRERFRREAQNSGRLNHPNIVAVFDTGEDDVEGLAIPFIVMERVHGRTLRDIIRNSGPLSPPEAAELLEPVAAALQSSHEAGIIHRDIKPANIMITNTGQVKVMDFGIARALDDSTSAMTQTSAVIGTAQYLSPEQARGKPADARSDVYALGCVLYEAITGRTPFEGETPFAVAYQHVQEEPTPPSELLDAVTLSPTARVNVDAVVLTSIAKHPADRYQSAYEMGQDLHRLAHGQVTRAARAHVAEQEDHYPPTSTIAPVAGTAAAAVAGAGTAGAGAHRAPVASTRPAYSEDSGSGTWMKWLATALAAVLVGIIAFFGWDYWQSDLSRRGSNGQTDSHAASNMVVIPEVAGRPRGEVVKQLEDMGLMVTVNEEANPTVARNDVIRVNPAAGSELQKNSTVTLTVSSGKEITDVPDLSGLTLEAAARTLKDAGLELDSNIKEEESQDVEAGQIISQNPTSGQQLSKGSKVKVTVSSGAKQVRVPSLTGMDWERAKSTLESLGLSPQLDVVDSNEPENHVLSVSDEGKQVDAGTVINVKVSNNMLITAPSLLHKNGNAAVSALRAAGWTGNASMLRTGAPIPTPVAVDGGLIGWASVTEGQTIRKDQTIDVRYWEFSIGALLPN